MPDRHEMWKSLSMDVDTHEGLCAALPVAFGPVPRSLSECCGMALLFSDGRVIAHLRWARHCAGLEICGAYAYN